MQNIGEYQKQRRADKRAELKKKLSANFAASENEPQIPEPAEPEEPQITEPHVSQTEGAPVDVGMRVGTPEVEIEDLIELTDRVEQEKPLSGRTRLGSGRDIGIKRKLSQNKSEEIIELTDLVGRGAGRPKNSETREDAELVRLKQEIERARKFYASKDYEITNVVQRLKNFFGKGMQTTSKNIADRGYLYKEYKDAVNDYMEYRIERMKENFSKLTPEEQVIEKENLKKEMGGLIKEVNWNEKLNLYEARTDARAEVNMDKWSHKLWEQSGKAINWYRKLDWKDKLALSIILLGSGIGAGLAATAGVSSAAGLMAFISTAKIGQRIMGSAAAGVGAVGYQEVFRRNVDLKKANYEKNQILKNLDDPNDGFELIRERLKSEIDTYENSLKREKRKAKNRRWIGLGVGAVVGSGALSYLAKAGFSYFNPDIPSADLNNNLREPIMKGARSMHTIENSDIEKPEAADLNNNLREPIMKGARPMRPIENADIVKPEVAPTEGGEESPVRHETVKIGEPYQGESAKFMPEAAAEGTQAVIEKGSSFQGTIIKYLTEQGVDKKEAGKMAHRMWERFAEDYPNPATKDYFVVHPGAKLEIGMADGQYRVLSFQDGVPDSPRVGVAIDETVEQPNEMAEQSREGVETSGGEREEAVIGKDSEVTVQEASEVSNSPVEKAAEEAAEEVAEKVVPANLPVEENSDTLLAKSDIATGVAGSAIAGAVASKHIEKGTEKIRESVKKKIVNLADRIREKETEKTVKNERQKELELKEKQAIAFKKIPKKYQFEYGESFLSRAKKTIRMISGDKLTFWSLIKNMNFSGLENKNSLEFRKLKMNIEKLEKSMINLNGDKAIKHREDESIKAWIARIVKTSTDSEMEQSDKKMAA